MHLSSYEHMKRLIEKYVDLGRKISVLDIGSYDVNGTYRTLFERINCEYTGIDLSEGPGVDFVLESPYRFPIKANSVDFVVSGQAFEHIEFFWLTWFEMVRVLKPDGYIFLIAPSRGPEHRYPQDCWRFYPDGYRALAKLRKCELIEVHTDWEPHSDPESSDWGDTVGVFKKSSRSTADAFLDFVQNIVFRVLHKSVM